MLRRDVSTALLATATGAALLPKKANAQSCTAPCYARTAAEITAGITPVNTSYPPLWVDRYGTNTTPGTTDMTTAIKNAIAVASVAGATGITGTCVILQATTYYVSSTISIPSGVTVQGAGGNGVGLSGGKTTGTGTNVVFAGSADTAAFCLGTSTSALSYFPAIADLAITLKEASTIGVQFLCSVNGSAQNIFVFNSYPGTIQSQIGFLIGVVTTPVPTVSCFFNTLTNCYAQNVHAGYVFNCGSGGVMSTQTAFLQCAALGLTASGDTTGYGIEFAQPTDGFTSTFHGCYFENFATGVLFNTTKDVNFFGTQFEGCTTDIAWSGADQYVGFFGEPDQSHFSSSGTMGSSNLLLTGGVFNGVTINNGPKNDAYSVAIGNSAYAAATSTDLKNTAIGYSAGSNLTTGSNCTVLGYGALASSATATNEFTLGDSSIATLRCEVTSITALSDARDKTAVRAIPWGLEMVRALKPVEFTWRRRDGSKVGIVDHGFVAQDLQEIEQRFGAQDLRLVYAENPKRLEATPGRLLPVYARAIQELDEKVRALEARLSDGS
jgi:Chaperone of endosialidase